MELRKKNLVSIPLMAAMLLAALVVLNGCKKSEPETTTPASDTMNQETAQMETDANDMEMQVASATEQTTCPVMGAPIDKNLFVEYEGKKVYFCCKGCETKFKENPEMYVSKLPQFNK
jgi:YHS domain-containing protein